MSRKVDLSKVSGVGRMLTEEEQAAETQGVVPVQSRPGRGERVISIPVTHIFPDPDQPRMPLLPFGEAGKMIREDFIGARIDCFEAVKRWIAISKKDVGHARRLRFLRDMAIGFEAEDGGQVNPVTVSVMNGGQNTYQIETGEQRFWATVLGYVDSGMNGPVPQLKVIVKPNHSRVRQVLENRHVGPPTVVTQAREIAMLLISEGLLDLPAEIAEKHPAERDPFEITRWVAKQRKSLSAWEHLEAIMGMSRPNMVKTLSISSFPTELLALADRYELSRRTLLEIKSCPEAQWADLFEQAIEEGWQSDEDIDYETVAPKPKKRGKPAHQKAFSGLKGFVRALGNSGDDLGNVIGEVADEVAAQKDEAAVEAYQYLYMLTENVRRRLLDTGLIEE